MVVDMKQSHEAGEQCIEKKNQTETVIANALGLWQGCDEDGLEYESTLRDEW